MCGCEYIIFSKLRKIGVNLAVSNYRVFQMPVIYVTPVSRSPGHPAEEGNKYKIIHRCQTWEMSRNSNIYKRTST